LNLPRHENIFRLREVGWKVVDWINLAQDRDQWWAFVNTVMNLWVRKNVGNFLTSRVIISFSMELISSIKQQSQV
jgi:hypothetical protein